VGSGWFRLSRAEFDNGSGKQIVLPTLAGTEVGVASTKAFTCQLGRLPVLLSQPDAIGAVLSADDEAQFVRALGEVPNYMSCVLELESKIRQLAREVAGSRNALFIGRGTNYPLALEGALKLKEITYIHAEAMLPESSSMGRLRS